MAFSTVLKSLRLQDDLTQSELAQKIGVSKSTISMYECGRREPDFETLEALADYFNVDMDYLIGKSDIERRHSFVPVIPDNILPIPSFHKVPRLGTIACGYPILAEENIEGYDDVPDYIRADFTLVCHGDSMINARIFDGDIVCIQQRPTVQSGSIAAVLIDDEATLKRVLIFDDHIILQPENPTYKPLAFWEEDMNRVRILGLATHFISTVK